MAAYYNEIDPQAAQWLRNLIAAGLIAPGEVDERSIRDVAPGDLVGFTQCHFFAGIGVWSYALRNAGWPDERPVWTGSCPCQPFSSAGKGEGFDDPRHLWPAWRPLIAERNPSVVFGEQVASPAGRTWLHDVRADLEGMGYAFGGADLCAAGIGAPHIRQRLYWVADTGSERREGLGVRLQPGESRFGVPQAAGRGEARGLAHGLGAGLEGHGRHGDDGHEPGRLDALETGSVAASGAARGLADGDGGFAGDGRLQRGGEHRFEPQDSSAGNGHPRAGPTNGYWRAADWLFCRDEKWRPVEPGTFPLAHGAPARVVRLRAYGNAIVAPVAEEFIRAYLEVSEP